MPTYRATFVRALGKSGSGLATILVEDGEFTNADAFVVLESPPTGIAAIEAKTLSADGLTFTATEDPADVGAKLDAAIALLTADWAAALTCVDHKSTTTGCEAGATGCYTFSLYPAGETPGPDPVTLVAQDATHECALHYLLGVAPQP